jgi:hypothetical protein
VIGAAPERRHRRRSVDATTWLVLALLVAVVLTLVARHEQPAQAGRPALHRSQTGTVPTRPTIASTTEPVATASPNVTSNSTPLPTTAPRTTAAPGTTTVERIAPNTAPAAERPTATTAPLAIVQVGQVWNGSLAFPNDVTTRYGFTTSGGNVTARFTSESTTALRVTLACRGASRRRSGSGELNLVAGPGPCTVDVAESSEASDGGDTAAAHYALQASFPGVVNSSSAP